MAAMSIENRKSKIENRKGVYQAFDADGSVTADERWRFMTTLDGGIRVDTETVRIAPFPNRAMNRSHLKSAIGWNCADWPFERWTAGGKVVLTSQTGVPIAAGARMRSAVPGNLHGPAIVKSITIRHCSIRSRYGAANCFQDFQVNHVRLRLCSWTA